jgi:hypothetical protein
MTAEKHENNGSTAASWFSRNEGHDEVEIVRIVS